MKRLALALSLLVPGAAFGADFPLTGQKGTVAETFIGCTQRPDYDKLISLVSSGDKEAWTSFMISRYPKCDIMPKGTEIFVEDVAVFSGASCARPKGKVDCFWFPSKLTTK